MEKKDELSKPYKDVKLEMRLALPKWTSNKGVMRQYKEFRNLNIKLTELGEY